MEDSKFLSGNIAPAHRGFGRMFPRLDPWKMKVPDLEMIMQYVRFRDPDGGGMPAGYTYLGQFVSHDLSLDISSSKGEPVQPEDVTNFRLPVFDLDSMYGGGPGMAPYLYDTDRASFILEAVWQTLGWKKLFWDIQRNGNRKGIIADHRNDENIVVSQLLVAFKIIHNTFVEKFKKIWPNAEGPEIFAKARQNTVWHYQWVVMYDLLGKLVCKTTGEIEQSLLEVKNDPFFSFSKGIFMPVEFSAAAFRLGHSQARDTYILNAKAKEQPLFFNQEERPNIFVDWSFFFEEKNASNLVDVIFTTAFEKSPSLVLKDIERGLKLDLPSGQCIAGKLPFGVLTEKDWVEVGSHLNSNIFTANPPDPLGFMQSAPLCYYILAEAMIKPKGSHLGPVGSHIVEKTILGLLFADKTSFINQPSPWVPKDEKGNDKPDFKMVDLLQLAGIYNGALVRNAFIPPPTSPPPPPCSPSPPAP